MHTLNFFASCIEIGLHNLLCLSFTCSFVRLENRKLWIPNLWQSQSVHQYYCLIECALLTKEIIQIEIDVKKRDRHTYVRWEKGNNVYFLQVLKSCNILPLLINDNDIIFCSVYLFIVSVCVLYSLLNIMVMSI